MSSSSLKLSPARYEHAGDYQLFVSNFFGTATSSPAALSVIAPVPRRVVPGVLASGWGGDLAHFEYADSLSSFSLWTPFGEVLFSAGQAWCFDLSDSVRSRRFYRSWQTNGGVSVHLDQLKFVNAVTLGGAIGSSVRVEAIERFGPVDSWTNLATVSITNSGQLFFDTTAPKGAQRLYRLVPQEQLYRSNAALLNSPRRPSKACV